MPHPLPRCPICGNEMVIKKLECPNCKITIEGEFWVNRLASLPQEELEFLELFLKTRGNVKEMERILKLSYPTVRSKLDSILKKLGLLSEEEEEPKDKVKWIINKLERGEITVQDALKILEEGEDV
ncbi:MULTISPECIES: DUF2089 domain-containing protein [Dictyoglomus]|jgi:hypothetical protein|uniref:DUF2089 domain-containing protein n=1 Tax=Dictyoglomus turgidum (strain DSM 6724 / Z-1310) TaxID=515635 RepID=B8DZT6_DICTD|nr:MULTISPECIES: DUF2089 domain-containing protein [Dictyoglomus]ACK42019.1 conserved hypothetical protein [Dictyoglomus turgidum DSM 6724]PNV80901.1 MAG: DUF2089 domain-containing protein [Dictyoglomus turgidum]HBU31420.1 DUF2089 domain-containing protein [Dictyoglomus sp.]